MLYIYLSFTSVYKYNSVHFKKIEQIISILSVKDWVSSDDLYKAYILVYKVILVCLPDRYVCANMQSICYSLLVMKQFLD